MMATFETSPLAIVVKDEPRIDTRQLAISLQQSNKYTVELIKDHINDFIQLGKVRFETAPLIGSKTGQKEKFALLNEDHAYLLLSYSRNTEHVRALKLKMIHAFSMARHQMELHINEYLPTYHEQHDQIKNMGLPADKEKFLHMNTNKLVNKCIGINPGERNALSLMPKSALVMAQTIATNAMRNSIDHKEAYQRMKYALELFGQLALPSSNIAIANNH